MKEIKIFFKNVEDFKRRIPDLWLNRKEDEIYDFIFPDRETEQAFDNLIKKIDEGNRRQE